MKISTTQPELPPAFKPRVLTLTFETQDELNGFATLFNCTPIANALEKQFNIDCSALSHAASQIGGSSSHTYPLAAQVKLNSMLIN